MTKRILCFLMSALLCTYLFISSYALSTPKRLVDDADLLDSDEYSSIKDKLDEISERQSFDVVIVTVDSTDGKSPRNFADDYYDENGYGQGSDCDGILLLISMEGREQSEDVIPMQMRDKYGA